MATHREQAQRPLRLQPQPFYVRVAHSVEDFIDDVSWLHVTFKICAYAYIAFVAWIAWQVLPLPGHWNNDQQSDKIPPTFQSLDNYFESFDGVSTCNIHATDLYSEQPPEMGNSFCPNRLTLLQAMSNGGRIGLDAPYISRDCRYRWFAIVEICMILERFDGIIFVGDDALQSVYNGLNVLLREDLANGALQTWSMSADAKADCRCESQFTKSDCARYFVKSSTQVSENSKRGGTDFASSYTCDRTAHVFLETNAGSPQQKVVEQFSQMLSKRSPSTYKPIAIVHSLSPMTASRGEALESLSEFLRLGRLSERKTPMLWIGPNAAGHVEMRGRKSNHEIRNFDAALAQKAREVNVEVLQMWNMTIQASSWDGIRFGEKVALVQAMMVVNWLSRLESS